MCRSNLLSTDDTVKERQAWWRVDNFLNLMRIGAHQLFSEFFQDFENKIFAAWRPKQRWWDNDLWTRDDHQYLATWSFVDQINVKIWLLAIGLQDKSGSGPSWKHPFIAASRPFEKIKNYHPQNGINVYITSRKSSGTNYNNNLDADDDTTIGGITSVSGGSRQASETKPRVKWKS